MEFLDAPAANVNLLFTYMLPTATARYTYALTYTFLTPTGPAPCLTIRCRKTLDVLVNCTTEEVA